MKSVVALFVALAVCCGHLMAYKDVPCQWSSKAGVSFGKFFFISPRDCEAMSEARQSLGGALACLSFFPPRRLI